MGWSFPWASSFGGDFNFDYSVGFTEEQQREGGVEYNYHREEALKPSSPSDQNVWGTGVDRATFIRERPGMSAFFSRTVSSSTPIRPMLAEWTPFGACGNGSTALPRGEMRRGTGGVATMSTTNSNQVIAN
jgi:hypothetical protein